MLAAGVLGRSIATRTGSLMMMLTARATSGGIVAENIRVWRCGGRSLSSELSSGVMNAYVLPLPVCAEPRTSLPSSAGGMAWTWIGIGDEKPMALMALWISGRRSNWENGIY